MTTYPWLITVKIAGAEFYRLVWSDTFENACILADKEFPGASFSSATIGA